MESVLDALYSYIASKSGKPEDWIRKEIELIMYKNRCDELHALLTVAHKYRVLN